MTDDRPAENEPPAGTDSAAGRTPRPGSSEEAVSPATSTPGDTAPAPATGAPEDTAKPPATSTPADTAPAPATGAPEQTAPAPAAGRPQRKLPLLLALAAVLYGLDLLTKSLAVAKLTPGDPVYLIGDVVRFSLVRNPGAAFSMATGMTWLLTLIATAVVIAVIRIGSTLRSTWWAIGLGMVLGGALGNLTDRLFRSPGPLQGHVVDFMAVGWWPVFNVADSAVVCGAILLVALTLFGFEPDGTRARDENARGEERTA